nr:hypothetical protein BaRGS_015478 [Batillaria attramentaria]
MGAPPPYSPGPADTYVPRGVEAEATSGPGVQASVSNTAARIGSGILQGMRRQSEQNQHHVSFGTSPFDDDFVPSPPVTQERRRSAGPEPVSFHAVCGRNASVSADQLEARRVQTEFRNAYIFTATPVTLGQQIVLKILSVDSLSRINGMAFGMTACDPAHIVASTLPDDADLLLDRLEYWVVVQDVCLNPEVGDEICISVSPDVMFLAAADSCERSPG